MSANNSSQGTAADIVCLQGGLGNQLFQLNFALQASCQEILIVQELENPELDHLLSQIQAKKVIQYFENKLSKYYLLLLARYLLHLDVNPSYFEGLNSVRRLILAISRYILRIILGRKVDLILESNKGGITKNSSTVRIFIGYFQRQLSTDKPFDIFGLARMEIAPHDKLDDYLDLSSKENPVIIHLRFGDYVGNKKFVQLDSRYYENAMNLISREIPIVNIWVFSNDINRAKRELLIPLTSNVRWIEKIQNSDAATLEVMRMGSGYIIANSTYSWWAATLKYSVESPVISPINWYEDDTEFLLPIPPNWKRI